MPLHPTAVIDSTAQLHYNVDIGPHCVIGANCVVGEGTVMMAGAVLCANSTLGKGNTLYHHALVGGDPQFLGFDPKTKSGTLVGDGNHFREFSQVHRGLKDGTNTVIGDGNFIMATAHVAHDCKLGNNNVLANYAGLAGHVEVGDKVFISTLVGVHQFCRIGSYAMLGGRTGVTKDVPPYSMMKHYGEVVGLNLVGLRRAGIPAETRRALQNAYRALFRSGRPLSKSIAIVVDEWAGRPMPTELTHFLEFCGAKSKRGMSRGPRGKSSTTEAGDDGDE